MRYDLKEVDGADSAVCTLPEGGDLLRDAYWTASLRVANGHATSVDGRYRVIVDGREVAIVGDERATS